MFEWIIELFQFADPLVTFAIFGIGGSKSSTSSRQRSESASFGFSRSDSLSESLGRSLSTGSSTQSIAFEDLFSKFFGGASEAASRIDTGGLGSTASRLFESGTGFLESLGGGEGAEFLTERLNGESDVLGEQIGALGEDLGRVFSETLLPEISRDATATGTLGGGRQGVAEGLAAQGITREFARGATELRAADLAQRTDAAGTLAGINQQASATGISALPGLFGLQEAGATAELGIAEKLSGILGDPTVLSESQQRAEATDIARAISEAFGVDAARSESRARSKGSSFGLEVGFGK